MRFGLDRAMSERQRTRKYSDSSIDASKRTVLFLKRSLPNGQRPGETSQHLQSNRLRGMRRQLVWSGRLKSRKLHEGCDFLDLSLFFFLSRKERGLSEKIERLAYRVRSF